MGNNFVKKNRSKNFFRNSRYKKKNLLDQEKKGEIYKKFKNIFSGVELLEVKKKD